MFYVDDDINSGTTASIVLIPTPNDLDLIEDAVVKDPVRRELLGAHIALINDITDVNSDLIGSTLRRVGSKFGAAEGDVTEIAEIEFNGEPFAQALVVESSTLDKIYNQTVNALIDGDVEIDPADGISLHMAVSTSSDKDAIKKEILEQRIKFDHFAVITKDDVVTYRLEGSDDDVDKFYISTRRTDCDGFAVVRTKDDGLVCCHANRTLAEEKMRELEEEAAGDRSSGLVRLGVEEETMPIKANPIGTFDVAGNQGPEPAPATFNIVDSDVLGSLPLERRAAAEQMAKLLNAKPDLEGPSIFTGRESGDGRIIHPVSFVRQDGNGLNLRQLPLPYMFGDIRAEHHLESKLGGWHVSAEAVPIDEDGNYAIYTKTKLLENSFGQEIYDAFARGEFRGVSADLDSVGVVTIEKGSKTGGNLNVLIAARFMGSTAVTFPALEEAGYWLSGDSRVLPDLAEEPLIASGGTQGYTPQLQIVTMFEESQEK